MAHIRILSQTYRFAVAGTDQVVLVGAVHVAAALRHSTDHVGQLVIVVVGKAAAADAGHVALGGRVLALEALARVAPALVSDSKIKQPFIAGLLLQVTLGDVVKAVAACQWIVLFSFLMLFMPRGTA